MIKKHILTLATLFSVGAFAKPVVVEMVDLGSNQVVGTVTITKSEYGAVFTPDLKGLPAGVHGFHLHENASCDSTVKNGKTILGGAAGGHYDPKGTGQHGTPWSDDNHLGDLPALYVDASGTATQPVIAPRVELSKPRTKSSDVANRALMIHAGGDNHSDHPAKLGGGGARIVCGVIK